MPGALARNEPGARAIGEKGSSFEKKDDRLTLSLRANADAKWRGRRSSQGKGNLTGRLAGFGAVATAVAYFAPRPTLVRLAVGLMVAFAGLCVYWRLESRHPTNGQTATESFHRAAPTPPRQFAAEDVRPDPGEVVSSSNARRGEEASAPAKALAQNKPIVAQRDPALEAWFIKSYLRCWRPPSTFPQGEKYAAQIRVVHNADGSLSGAPLLVNPPSDPEWRSYADSAMRAVAKCPLRVPVRYLAHFDQWRKMTLHFSPDGEM